VKRRALIGHGLKSEMKKTDEHVGKEFEIFRMTRLELLREQEKTEKSHKGEGGEVS